MSSVFYLHRRRRRLVYRTMPSLVITRDRDRRVFPRFFVTTKKFPKTAIIASHLLGDDDAANATAAIPRLRIRQF